MRVSVIMSTHCRNRSNKFCSNQLIRSVNAILEQTHTDFELLIADDASTDGTEVVLQKFCKSDPRVRTFRFEKPCNGMTSLRYNFLREQATSEYIMEAFDDEMLYPNALEILVKVMKDNPELDMVYAIGKAVNAETNISHLHGSKWSDDIYHTNIVPCGAVLMHKRVHDKIGYGDCSLELRRWADHEFWIRMRYNNCKVLHIPELIAEGFVGNKDSIGTTIPTDHEFNARYLKAKYPNAYK